jgi:lipoprotein-anchoring transpeptidase ErfK/SrfK
MRTRTLQVAATIATCIAFIASSPNVDARTKQGAARQRGRPARAHAAKAPPDPACGDYTAFQILLDRQAFSPGQIDGHPGSNLTHALTAFQNARRLPPTGEADCDTWRALGGETIGDLYATYTITAEDLKGPFQPEIPRELTAQANLPALAYKTPVEMLGERFHASPALLQRLNRGGAFHEGQEIRVPGVTPFDANAKPAPDSNAADLIIQVTRSDSSLRAIRGDGTVAFFAPVTTGSEHDPLPTGDYKVTGYRWWPPFHYNPNLFWDAKPGDSKATIKAGPNNPVGVVWIALSLEHYGLHGTPEPGNIGKTESHGCVRMTNWDAARVAALVRPGTPVQFRDAIMMTQLR